MSFQLQKIILTVIPPALLGLYAILILPSDALSTENEQPSRVLVLSETAGWDHNTREAANQLIIRLGQANGFNVETSATSEPWFTDDSLAGFGAVCCINTTGPLFTDEESAAFRRYIENGGGFVGMHACTDAEYEHPWYGDMTGANFNGHPFNIAPASVAVVDRQHPSVSFITVDTLQRSDEWYFWGDNPDFRNNPLIDPAGNPDIHVLLTLVESSIPGSSLSLPHPICWYRSYGSGRVWYCGFGHDPQTYNDTLVGKMLLGGILYAMGTESAVATEKHTAIPVLHTMTVNEPAGLFDLRGRRICYSRSDQRNSGAVVSVNVRSPNQFMVAPGALIHRR